MVLGRPFLTWQVCRRGALVTAGPPACTPSPTARPCAAQHVPRAQPCPAPKRPSCQNPSFSLSCAALPYLRRADARPVPHTAHDQLRVPLPCVAGYSSSTRTHLTHAFAPHTALTHDSEHARRQARSEPGVQAAPITASYYIRHSHTILSMRGARPFQKRSSPPSA